VGSIAPDLSRPVIWIDAGVTAAAHDAHTVVLAAGARAPRTAGRVLQLVDAVDAAAPTDGIALARWDEATLDTLSARNWRLTSAAPLRRADPPRLDGLRVIHATSVHKPDDGRIFHKEVMSLRAAGADATVLGFDARPSRRSRIGAGWGLVAEARRRGAEVLHIHDPELLPAAWNWRRSTGRPVIYDAHEYLGQTTRTKPWIPQPLRVPTAVAVERIERALARRVDAVVAVTEDMALGFAQAGVRAISVANFAPAERFPEPGSPEPGLVLYVGALDSSRGRELMLEAFPLVDTPGARLLLAGPGTPGPLPPNVEYMGPVAYEDVPALLNRASVVWIPLRRTPNNDRGRLTKVMEAMASGRPLVASDLTRTAAIVRQAGCGTIVPFDDPGAHAAAIADLLYDPSRAAAMGAAGRAAFLERMTFDGEAAKLVALYAELTGRTR
jgi:glycosyltransferase involved in cell wall biosynthesis